MSGCDSPKYWAPKPAPRLIRRARLEQALARGLSGRVILLSAPAGYGKTSLLAAMVADWHDLFESTAPAVAWYSLTAEDDDAAVFLSGLISAVQQLDPSFGSITRAALRETGDARGQFDRLFALFLDELAGKGEPFPFIVLDDLHHVTDRVVVEGFERAILSPGSPLRLVMASETEPHIYLAPFRSRDELLEIGPADLRFTPEETGELVRILAGNGIQREVVDQVAKETSGWPSAAHLASLIVARNGGRSPFTRFAPTDHGYDRMLRELLMEMPAESRMSVLKSALVDQLDPTLLREGLSIPDPVSLMRLVEGAGLPVSRRTGPDGASSYDTHFRDALGREVKRTFLAEEYHAIMRRLAAYYAGTGNPVAAFAGYLEANAPEEAASVAELAAETQMRDGHLDRVLRWIHSLPGPVRDRHPRLMLFEARILMARERLEEARVLLVSVRDRLEASGDRGGEGLRLSCWAELQLREARSETAVASARQSLELLDEGNQVDRARSYWLLSRALEGVGDLVAATGAAERGLLEAEMSGQLSAVVRGLIRLGELAFLRGRYSDALAFTGNGYHVARMEGTELLALAQSAWIVASIHTERGHLREAVAIGSRGVKAGERLKESSWQVSSGLALALAYDRQGQQEASVHRRERAVELSAQLPRLSWERVLALQHEATFLLRGKRVSEGVARARQALQLAESISHRPMADQSRMIVSSVTGSGNGLLPTLLEIRRLTRVFADSDSKRWLSGAYRLMAQRYWEMRMRRPARRNLLRSLELASEEGWVDMPLGLPTQRQQLLQLAVEEGVLPEVAGALIGAAPREGRKAVEPARTGKDAEARLRAEQLLKGLEVGNGTLAPARSGWPGYAEDDTEPGATVGFRVLGKPSVSVGGQAAQWPSRDAFYSATYLLMRREELVPREQMLFDLWPGIDRSVSNARLHVALYQLGETLGHGFPAMEREEWLQGRLLWSGASCELDEDGFVERLREAERQLGGATGSVLSDGGAAMPLPSGVAGLLKEAVEMYGGDYMEGVPFSWCEARRLELRGGLLWATGLLMAHHMALGEWSEAIRYGQTSLEADPLREDTVRDLMFCHHRVGERDAVARRYGELKRLLAKDSGAWPSDETRRLRVRLLGR